jgi:hypothetical protein
VEKKLKVSELFEAVQLPDEDKIYYVLKRLDVKNADGEIVNSIPPGGKVRVALRVGRGMSLADLHDDPKVRQTLYNRQFNSPPGLNTPVTIYTTGNRHVVSVIPLRLIPRYLGTKEEYKARLVAAEEKKKKLSESFDFGVAKFVPDHPDFPEGLYSMAEFEREEMGDCPSCEGTGKDWQDDSQVCLYCDGKKKVKVYKTDYEQLNTNNTNGMLIVRDLFGIQQPEAVGHLEPEKLPEILKKLKAMKRDHDMEFFKQVQGELDHPGAARAKHNIPYRWDNDDVNHYLNSLISMIEFAIKNNAVVVWS